MKVVVIRYLLCRQYLIFRVLQDIMVSGYMEHTRKRLNLTIHFLTLSFFPGVMIRFSGINLQAFSALYSMPLFSPDWQLGHFIYIKRVKTAVFYDYAQSKDLMVPSVFSSTGIDLSMDFRLFNFVSPFDAGIRSVYIPETGQMKFQLLFSPKSKFNLLIFISIKQMVYFNL